MEFLQWVWLSMAGLGLAAILFFNRQLKSLFRLVRNGALGALGIWLVNLMLGGAAVTGVGINLLTVFLVGVLGVPGFFLLFVTRWIVG